MQEFEIRLRSVQDVQEFVALSTEQPFPVFVGNGNYRVDAKCFMEMFCLDFTRPLYTYLECAEEEFCKFRKAVEQFVVEP